MKIPADIKYTKDHEWARIENDVAWIGITDFAQSELGDIVYVELPQIGDELEKQASFGTIEAVKAVSDLYTPLSGEVLEVNSALDDTPEVINEDPYTKGWMIKIKIKNMKEVDELLDNSQYEALI